MTRNARIAAIEDLPRAPASDVKKLGWRGLMKAIDLEGKMVVTNHNAPEAVILSIEEYRAIMRALQAASAKSEPALDALRRRFDERLASLQAEDAGDRLRALMKHPARLAGKVKAGASY